MTRNHPEYYEHLRALIAQLSNELPRLMSGFGQVNREAVAEGALPARVKELIALGIAICVRCDGCVAYHVHDALRAGATRQEILEAIGVAILMGGGPAAAYGAEALEALDQFGANPVDR